MIDFANAGEANYGIIVIAVDINGFNKRPNRLGHDVFWFQINPDGSLIPMGGKDSRYPADTYCNPNSSNAYNGAGCTHKAVSDKEYFNTLPR